MNTKKFVTVMLAAGAVAFAGTVLSAVPATAHTPEVSASCSTMTVNLHNYTADRKGSRANHLTVEIDSKNADDATFGSSFSRVYSLGDSAAPHDYVVTLDAIGTEYDRVFTGTSVPCVSAAAAADASASVSITPPTCESSGVLVLGSVENAVWGTPSAKTGPATYSVTATAVADHTFGDGTTTKTFDGSLAGPLAADAALCATVVVPEPPVPTTVVTEEEPPAVPATPAATTAAAPPATLAATGSDAGAMAPIGALLLLAGASLVVARRISQSRIRSRS